MSGKGRVSRTHRLSTTVRNCTRDEGGPFEAGSQVQVSSHRKLLSSRAMVVLLPERKRQFSQPPLDPVCLDVRKILAVDTRRALVGAALGIGMRQNVAAADLVVQSVEAIAGFRLRFRV